MIAFVWLMSSEEAGRSVKGAVDTGMDMLD